MSLVYHTCADAGKDRAPMNGRRSLCESRGQRRAPGIVLDGQIRVFETTLLCKFASSFTGDDYDLYFLLLVLSRLSR